MPENWALGALAQVGEKVTGHLLSQPARRFMMIPVRHARKHDYPKQTLMRNS
jgi:hypothetical protein